MPLECNLSDSTHIFAKPENYVRIASLHYRNVLVLRSAVLPFDPFAWLPYNFYDVMTQCTCIRESFHIQCFITIIIMIIIIIIIIIIINNSIEVFLHGNIISVILKTNYLHNVTKKANYVHSGLKNC